MSVMNCSPIKTSNYRAGGHQNISQHVLLEQLTEAVRFTPGKLLDEKLGTPAFMVWSWAVICFCILYWYIWQKISNTHVIHEWLVFIVVVLHWFHSKWSDLGWFGSVAADPGWWHQNTVWTQAPEMHMLPRSAGYDHKAQKGPLKGKKDQQWLPTACYFVWKL